MFNVCASFLLLLDEVMIWEMCNKLDSDSGFIEVDNLVESIVRFRAQLFKFPNVWFQFWLNFSIEHKTRLNLQ
jgi:hypothetical protein